MTAIGRVLRCAVASEAGRQPGDPVAMAHPDRIAPRPCARRPRTAALRLHLDLGASELAMVPAFDTAAELGGHRHLPVADAEHRHAAVEDRLRRARAAFLVHGLRAAGQDDGLRLHVPKGLSRRTGTARSPSRRPPPARAAR